MMDHFPKTRWTVSQRVFVDVPRRLGPCSHGVLDPVPHTQERLPDAEYLPSAKPGVAIVGLRPSGRGPGPERASAGPALAKPRQTAGPALARGPPSHVRGLRLCRSRGSTASPGGVREVPVPEAEPRGIMPPRNHASPPCTRPRRRIHRSRACEGDAPNRVGKNPTRVGKMAHHASFQKDNIRPDEPTSCD